MSSAAVVIGALRALAVIESQINFRCNKKKKMAYRTPLCLLIMFVQEYNLSSFMVMTLLVIG